MSGPRRRLGGPAIPIAALFLLSGIAADAAELPPTLGPVDQRVAVEIVEGLPDNRSWDFTPAIASQRYTAPAFGFVGLPKKYTAKGIVTGRASPFLLRATTTIQPPAGDYRLLLRARGASRLYFDGAVVLQTSFRQANADGHEAVPETPKAVEPGLRPLQAGQQEQLATVTLDGGPHEIRLEVIVGDQKLRPELGELSVSIAAPGETFKLLSKAPSATLTDEEWRDYAAAAKQELRQLDRDNRLQNGAGETEYWQKRHELARTIWAEKHPQVPGSQDPALSPIDRLIEAAGGSPDAGPIDDYAFLRRVTLDTVGVIPTREEISRFLADPPAERRSLAIERLLNDDRWADHWVSYWQDVLAENPGILKPQLNNTGPFRGWLYEALLDDKPLDRFATELVMMEGGLYEGGPAGFGMASQNDAPLAEKGHVLAKAFLGVELKCARCHDAPLHPFKQKDTFSLAAMLDRAAQKLPETSTVPRGGRQPLVEVTLKPGDQIEPTWPFSDLSSADPPADWIRDPQDSRERLAALLTGPENARFPQVAVNRLWKRMLGQGLVEPVDDWFETEPANGPLLDYLAYELVTHDYSLKHVARLILNSRAYQSSTSPEEAAVTLRARRRMTAEQLIDSLFLAAGKPIGAEELTFDPEGRRPADEMQNLGVPERAWQFASLSNERDRPALSLPVAQSVLDVLTTFGWRESRHNPLTVRDDTPNPLQPLTLANGVVAARVDRLSDDSALTKLCMAEVTPQELVEQTFLQILSRPPNAAERLLYEELLTPGFAERRKAQAPLAAKKSSANAVSWSNHLSPEASRIKLELEKAVREGDPPTQLLTTDWRERMEDMVWSLINAPEFVFVP